MKRYLPAMGIVSVLCVVSPNLSAQNSADFSEPVSPQLQMRIRKLIATLGPDPSRNTCMPNSSLPANQAREELIAIGKPATLPLCAVLTEKSDWRRGMAAEALTEIRDPRSFEPLLRTLRFDSNITVRGDAAEALGNLGDSSVVPLLINTLKIRDPKTLSPANTAGRAAQALGKLGDARAIPALLNLLGSRETVMISLPMGIPSSFLGTEAAEALAQFGSAVTEPLMERMHHPNPKVRVDAAKALGLMKESRAVPLLLTFLSASAKVLSEDNFLEDANFHRQAIIALGEIGDRRATQPLLAKLDVPKLQRGDREGFEYYVIEALGKIADPEAVPTLLQLLSAPRNSLRDRTLIALSQIQTPDVIEPMLEALQREKDFNVRSSLVKGLAQIKETRALPLLSKLLEEENIGGKAAAAIGQIDNGLLLSLLDSKNNKIRRAVIEGLGEMGCMDAVPQLTALIRDKTLGWRAVIALGEIGTPDLLPLLEPLMRDPSDPNPWHARRAVIAIKQRYKL